MALIEQGEFVTAEEDGAHFAVGLAVVPPRADELVAGQLGLQINRLVHRALLRAQQVRREPLDRLRDQVLAVVPVVVRIHDELRAEVEAHHAVVAGVRGTLSGLALVKEVVRL